MTNVLHWWPIGVRKSQAAPTATAIRKASGRMPRLTARLAPIAATFAGELGYRPEAFLMATAVGAGCDFLTPIGHQCNTLVMGPGGYRFGDYARLGAPLSLLVVVVGVPLILAVWPLR